MEKFLADWRESGSIQIAIAGAWLRFKRDGKLCELIGHLWIPHEMVFGRWYCKRCKRRPGDKTNQND